MRTFGYHSAVCLLGLLGFVASCWNASAATPSNGTVKGTVLDRETRAPLPGVNIAVEGTTTGTITDADGLFEMLNLPNGTYTLTFSMIGYRSDRVSNIDLGEDAVVDIGVFELTRESIPLNEIVVTPGRFSIMGAADLSRQVLSSEDLKNMSWAEDITRAVARLPGISSSDYSSKFTIRGGESDEVLLTLDGMELYEPFHQRDYSGGLFSIIDIETIDGIDLMTGGYSAEYGNRLSGVFNMRTKSIPQGQRHTSLGLSMINARFYTDGSFGNGKGSYILSARRGMLDALFTLVSAAEEATIDQGSTPSFYDLMGKLEYELSPKHRVSFHALRAGDRTKVVDVEGDNFDKNDNRFGNTYGWLTLNSNHSTRLFSRTLLYAGWISHDRNGSFYKDEPSDKGSFMLTDQRDYTLLGIKQDWNWQTSNKLFLSGGFEVKQINAKYDYFSHLAELRVNADEVLFDYDMTRDIEISPSGQQLGMYVTGRFKVLPKLVMETGLRYDKTTYSKDDFFSPRVGIAYAFSENTTLRGAWGYYYQTQFINDLDVNHGITSFNPAELAKHYVLGLEQRFRNGLELRVEGYYKDLSSYSPAWQNLRDHLEIFPEARNDNALVVRNGAQTQGIELFLKYDKGGKISWWLSYALARAEDDVAAIEFDGLLTKRTGNVTRLNNQRHTVYADVNYRPNDQWHFNLSWTYYKGWPRTDYIYEYQTLSNGDLHFYPVHKEFNGTLYPAFHRMDLRTNRRFKTGRSTITAFLHLINLYNRENLKKFDLDTRDDEGNFSLDDQGNYVPFRDDKYWFGFTPIIGVSWEF